MLNDELILKLWQYQQRLVEKLAQAFPGSYGPDAVPPATPATNGSAAAAAALPALKKVYYRRLAIHLEVSVNLDGSLFDGDGLGLPGLLQSLGVVFGNIDKACRSTD
jgi:hypothetical protein